MHHAILMVLPSPVGAPPPLHPVYLQAAVGPTEAVAGLHLAPRIPVPALRAALAYAPPAQAEMPLALLDDTILASGKAGLLLTASALYVSATRARVPLELILHAPQYPLGFTEAGVLPTAHGPVTLPRLGTEEGAIALNRLLRAVAFYQRGGARVPYGPLPFFGPVAERAAHFLQHDDLVLVPRVPTHAMHAASAIGPAWLDADSGEELLAFVDDTFSRCGERFLALTDRRLLCYTEPERPLLLPYAAVAGAQLQKGMLSCSLVVHTAQGPAKVSSIAPAEALQALAGFLQSLTTVPPEQRLAWPAPPQPEDPSGALTALRSLSWPDLRVASLFELVHAAARGGSMPPEVAADLVRRVARFQRTLRGGHALTQGMLRTALSAGDLVQLLSVSLGAPVHQTPLDAHTTMLAFDLRKAGSGVGTIASSVLGLTLLAVVGVGWIGGGGGGPRTVLVRVTEAPGGAAFALLDERQKPLAQSDQKLAGGLLAALTELTAPVLLRRVLLGWGVPSSALESVPPGELDARARALLPSIDLAPFVQER